MAPPASSARALHNILKAVSESVGRGGTPASYHAWGKVVGAEVPSTEFAQFHSEAASLLSEVAEGVRRLNPSTQARFMYYVPAWWDALVQPRADWAAVTAPFIDKKDLDMLGSLADLMEAHASLADPGNPRTVDGLTKAVAHILGVVVNQATGIPPSVRDQIVADLKHVQWLLNHVDTFGVDHAVAALEGVTGKVTAVATKTGSHSLKQIAVGLIAALAFSSTATTQVATIVENVQSVFGLSAEADPGGGGSTAESTVIEIYNVFAPKALTNGPTTTSDDDTIDGEIVEEGDEATG